MEIVEIVWKSTFLCWKSEFAFGAYPRNRMSKLIGAFVRVDDM